MSRVLSALAVFTFCLGSGSSNSSDVPRVLDVTPMQFVGERICVCGNFPTPEALQGITIDGKPVGSPEQGDQNVAVIRIPADLTPGTHMVGGLYSAFFPRSDQKRFLALKYRASITKQVLRPGESTGMTVVIEGTTQPIQLALANLTPAVAVLEGGQAQTVMTSGGTPNQVQRTITGIQPYQFQIQIFLPDATCPCAATTSDTSEKAEPSDVPPSAEPEPAGEPATELLPLELEGPPETPTPCQVEEVKGAMEPSQGVWQDDPFFKKYDPPKARNKLIKLSDTHYRAELAMVHDRPTLVFGTGVTNFNEILIEGTTTGSYPVNVKVVFTLYEGVRKLMKIYEHPVKNPIDLDGVCTAKKSFKITIPTPKGLPEDSAFRMSANNSYRIEAELVRAATDAPTGIKIEVEGPVVNTQLPRLYFVPVVFSRTTAKSEQTLLTNCSQLAQQAKQFVDDQYPLKPNSVDTVVVVKETHRLFDIVKKADALLQRLQQLPSEGGKSSDLRRDLGWEKEEIEAALIADFLTNGRKLAREGIVFAVMGKDDYSNYLKSGTITAGLTLSNKVIALKSPAQLGTAMHEMIHSRNFLWSDPEMVAECGINYHNKPVNYTYGVRIMNGTSEDRRRLDAFRPLMGASRSKATLPFDAMELKVDEKSLIAGGTDGLEIYRWINHCSYAHLIEQLQTKGDPPVILVRGILARQKDQFRALFFPAYQFDGYIELPAGEGGPWAIVLKNGHGQVISRHPFKPVWRFSEDAADRRVVAFSYVIEDQPGAARIDLEGPSGLLASKLYSQNAPQIRVLHPQRDSTISGKQGTVQVEWEGEDPDGDPLLYTLLYSADEGEHWTDRLFEERKSRAIVKIDPKAQKHLVKIIATDGARSSEIVLPFSSD